MSPSHPVLHMFAYLTSFPSPRTANFTSKTWSTRRISKLFHRITFSLSSVNEEVSSSEATLHLNLVERSFCFLIWRTELSTFGIRWRWRWRECLEFANEGGDIFRCEGRITVEQEDIRSSSKNNAELETEILSEPRSLRRSKRGREERKSARIDAPRTSKRRK